MVRATYPWRIAALAVWSIALVVTGCAEMDTFSAADEAAVREAVQTYVMAWLSNDADAVMATLSDDIVLQPHHGGDPVVSAQSVRSWWFPDGPPTTITAFTVETTDVGGSGSLAYAWGRSSVAWDHEGESFFNEGNALSVLTKVDGAWRISHQIWNDPLPEVR